MNDAAKTPVELREVEVDGRAVRYRVAGSGEPLVLVHGLAGSWRWWSPLFGALAASRFRTAQARAMFTGLGAHSMLSLRRRW